LLVTDGERNQFGLRTVLVIVAVPSRDRRFGRGQRIRHVQSRKKAPRAHARTTKRVGTKRLFANASEPPKILQRTRRLSRPQTWHGMVNQLI
jgi:hypothetical protein